jgi:hypothetical protein
VRFSELVQYFRRLEGTSGRNALVESLSEHMRQHARQTEADRATEDTVRAFHLGEGEAVVPILSPNSCQRAMKGEATM